MKIFVFEGWVVKSTFYHLLQNPMQPFGEGLASQKMKTNLIDIILFFSNDFLLESYPLLHLGSSRL
jgi:hypothetical protein